MTSEKNSNRSIVIIGAGMGGLGMAMALKREWGFEDFVIIERASEVGGTWRENVYPGCASDVPIHGYSFSTDLKPDWNKSHGLQPEIQDYLLDLTSKYGLRSHCVFDTAVVSADWDEKDKVWRIVSTNTKTGATTTTNARIVVSAMGILAEPNLAKLPGHETFKGITFHSAQWREDVDLRRKRVAIIGNGCSATQIAPIITEDPTTDVTNFCRTPMWYVDGAHVPYSPFWKWIYAHVPLAALLHRWKIQASFDINYISFRGRNSWLHRRITKQLEAYIKTHAPEDYHDKIIPTYTPGCKRLIRDRDYLACLHRPNMRQNWDGIQNLTEDGIVTKTGEHIPFDVIVYATGFITDKFPVHVRGRSGLTVSEYYDENGGPTGYLGSTIPGFPNFFTIMGPNLTTGHASVIFAEEVQFNYALKLFKPVLDGALAAFEPTAAATDRYNAWLQRRLSNSVWTQCQSWYRVGTEGKIFSTFPGAMALFWLAKAECTYST
ncbi:FAD/NAD-P-binding domain-containing protein [Amylostereum chailletii]|nr:FAD/NAD-P-binding domain-containing protein [Amylostereum chailletii]